MKCKDCEIKVEKVNKDGICPACARRKAQRKHAGKEYVPLKNLKGTWQYDLAIKMRNKNKENENNKNKDNDKKETISNIKDKYYWQVSKDVEKSFKEEKITKEYLNFDLESFIEIFYSLMQEENYVTDAKKAEEIFNKTSIDLIHAIENSSWEGEEIKDIVYQEKALLELRRPTKTILCYYKMLEPIVEYLKEDTYFLELLGTLRIDFIKNNEKIKRAEYFPRQSHLASKQKNYDCSVMCYNLYGKQTLEELKANGGIWAKDENEAKKVFLKFINSSFPTITYNSDDIKIELNEEF